MSKPSNTMPVFSALTDEELAKHLEHANFSEVPEDLFCEVKSRFLDFSSYKLEADCGDCGVESWLTKEQAS